MKLPTPKFLAKQPIGIEFYDSKTDENGENTVLSELEVMCRYQQSDETSYLPNGKKDLEVKQNKMIKLFIK